MAQLSDNRYVGYQGVYPIVEYARKIGKSTAEFSTMDMVRFNDWWIKQPQRSDLMEGTIVQRKQYEADVAAMKQYREDEKMGKNSAKNKAAMMSRLSKEIEEDGDVDMDQVVVEEIVEEVPAEEIVCSMELTKIDVEALLWAINEIFENYDLTGTTHDLALNSLKEGLEGV